MLTLVQVVYDSPQLLKHQFYQLPLKKNEQNRNQIPLVFVNQISFLLEDFLKKFHQQQGKGVRPDKPTERQLERKDSMGDSSGSHHTATGTQVGTASLRGSAGATGVAAGGGGGGGGGAGNLTATGAVLRAGEKLV